MLISLTDEEQNTIRRIADYEKISGILWIILGVIQICLIITIIAGIWNIFAGISRLNLSKSVRLRGPGVVAAFEPVGQLIIIAVINLIFGGVLGVLFIAFDFYVRDFALSNRKLFEMASPLRKTSQIATPPMPVSTPPVPPIPSVSPVPPAPPVSAEFMVARDGQQYGPYSKALLRQYLKDGNVSAEDLAWTQGMDEWMPLGAINISE